MQYYRILHCHMDMDGMKVLADVIVNCYRGASWNNLTLLAELKAQGSQANDCQLGSESFLHYLPARIAGCTVHSMYGMDFALHWKYGSF